MTLLAAGFAGLPILIIVITMAGFHWPAARAGIVGLAAALVLAVFTFGLGRERYAELGVAGAGAGALAEAVFTALTILWIILPALGIHHVQTKTGSIEVVKSALGRVSGDPAVLGLLVAWFFALFLEGAAGFGTTIALAAPFLVGLGLRPVEAVSAALIGHAVGVTFGAVGTPILPQIAATGFSAQQLAAVNALYGAAFGWVFALLTMRVLLRSLGAGRALTAPIWRWTLLAAAFFLLPYWSLAQWVGPELPTLGGALIGGAAFLAVFTRSRRAPAKREVRADAIETQPPLNKGRLARALAPYLVLIALILITRLIPPVKQALTGVVWEWSLWGTFTGSVQPFYHPGTLLAAALLLGAIAQGAGPRVTRDACLAALRQLRLVIIALIAMLGVSRVLLHAGMIDALAAAAAAAAGPVWPLFAPYVGLLGTFVTGSATASNVLFADFQQATADQLGLSVLVILGAQGIGAAIGNIVAPHNIIAGSATVGLSGQEGAVLRRTLVPALLYGALSGLLALLLSVLQANS